MEKALRHRLFVLSASLMWMGAHPVVAQGIQGLPHAQQLPHPALASPAIPNPGMPLWMLICGVMLALGLTVVVLWLLFKYKHTHVTEPAVPPLSRAQRDLEDLMKESDQLPPEETAHRVSVILRTYQEGRYLVPAPYRTREELYERGEMTTRSGVRERFGPIALLCDHIAFAPIPATKIEATALIRQSLEALRQEAYHLTDSLPRSADMPPPLPHQV